jgi:DNA repair protein RadC
MAMTIDDLVTTLLGVGELPHGLMPRDLLDPDVVPPDATAAKVFALRELIRSGGLESTLSGTLSTSADVARFFVPRLANEKVESMWLVGLDSRNRVRFTRCIARGSTSRCAASPAEIVRPLVVNGTPAGILVHNHPSGDPAPSADDLAFTVGVSSVFDLLGHRLLDHVVVGAEGYASMRDAGLGPWAEP